MSRRVSGAPFPAGGGQLSCGGHARQVDLHSGRFWEHAKAKDVIGAASRGEHEPELARDPRNSERNARVWAEIEHTSTVVVWGLGPKRTRLKEPFGVWAPNEQG